MIIVEQDELLFNLWERAWPETKVNWEIIRTAGRLPLFAASYSAIILIPIFFYGLALYNKSIEGALKWANPIVTNPTHEMQSLANFLEFTLHPQPLPSLSLVLLVSTLLLAVASTLFTFRCPSRIKEFSRDQWCDQLGKSLIHYWPLAWQERWIRLICAACYLIGGFGAVYVIGTKVLKVAWFIIENS